MASFQNFTFNQAFNQTLDSEQFHDLQTLLEEYQNWEAWTYLQQLTD